MNLFDAPAWAEALLGNKVKFPSFGTNAPAPIELVSDPAPPTQVTLQAFETTRKKPGPKPGSKRKVKE
jgi:hypothetical protein